MVDIREVVDREWMWLTRLWETGGPFPRPVDRGHTGLTVEYVGERLTIANLPPDWGPQGLDILDCLREVGCCHNDIRPENLMVHQGRLHLVGFGWATAQGEKIPEEWPETVGGDFKLGPKRFSDSWSMWMSLKHIYDQLNVAADKKMEEE